MNKEILFLSSVEGGTAHTVIMQFSRLELIRGNFAPHGALRYSAHSVAVSECQHYIRSAIRVFLCNCIGICVNCSGICVNCSGICVNCSGICVNCSGICVNCSGICVNAIVEGPHFCPIRLHLRVEVSGKRPIGSISNADARGNILH